MFGTTDKGDCAFLFFGFSVLVYLFVSNVSEKLPNIVQSRISRSVIKYFYYVSKKEENSFVAVVVVFVTPEL